MEFKREIKRDNNFVFATITSKTTLKEGKMITIKGDYGNSTTLTLKETNQLIGFLEEALLEIEKMEAQNG